MYNILFVSCIRRSVVSTRCFTYFKRHDLYFTLTFAKVSFQTGKLAFFTDEQFRYRSGNLIINRLYCVNSTCSNLDAVERIN